MANNLKYMPTFRVRQQENIVLRSFDFGANMYPLLEIVKEVDRKRQDEKQQPFNEIHLGLINDITAGKVFVDMPIYLRERASTKDEVLSFSRAVISNREVRTEYLLSLSLANNKIIPVISSYLNKTGEANSIQLQVAALRPTFNSIAYRVLFNHFADDWPDIIAAATANDFIILDLDTIAPYPSPGIKQIINTWQGFNTCPKIVLRSAINDVQNVSLTHNEIVFDADNGLLETYKISFKASAFGDYAGIKKDDLTSGGTISPGFLFYDAVNNQFIGFKGEVKNLSEFEITIVPDVLACQAAIDMQASGFPYLDGNNVGWQILNNISGGGESGKSQAKFKRIAIEHYLHCIKVKINTNQII
jgi:Beta protein